MNARRPAPIDLPTALSPIDGRQAVGPLSCIRQAGHEEAFAELIGHRVTDAAGLMSQARRFYLVHASTLGHEPVAWEDLSVLTVRAWVAVAREARTASTDARGWDPLKDKWP